MSLKHTHPSCLHVLYVYISVCCRLNVNCFWLFSGASDPQVPPGQGCPTPGCNGVGHIKGPRYGTHYTLVTEVPGFLFTFVINRIGQKGAMLRSMVL